MGLSSLFVLFLVFLIGRTKQKKTRLLLLLLLWDDDRRTLADISNLDRGFTYFLIVLKVASGVLGYKEGGWGWLERSTNTRRLPN